MTDLAFSFHGHSVRVVFDGSGDPWWVGADICAALEIEKARNSLALLASDERGAHIVGTLGGPQSMTTVNEFGLYRLVFASRKPAAEAFKRWLAHDVLPAIRRTGRYDPAAADPEIGEPPASAEYWLALVRETRLTHGRAAAARIWRESPLPQVQAAGPATLTAEATVDELCTAFLRECCVITGGRGDFIRSRTLLEAILRYAQERGMGWPGDRSVSNALRRAAEIYRDPDTGRRMQPAKRSDTGYLGVRLRAR